jgi:hypothetical protein
MKQHLKKNNSPYIRANTAKSEIIQGMSANILLRIFCLPVTYSAYYFLWVWNLVSHITGGV